jgi:hypothetical protein
MDRLSYKQNAIPITNLSSPPPSAEGQIREFGFGSSIQQLRKDRSSDFIPPNRQGLFPIGILK